MAGTQIRFAVQYEDGETTEVVAGQREMAAWEMEPFGTSSMSEGRPMLFFRYLAWRALKSRKQIRESFTVWGERVLEVMPLEDDEDLEGEQAGVGPTRPEARPGL